MMSCGISFHDRFPKQAECTACFGQIDSSNYVLYKDDIFKDWITCGYCLECVEYMLQHSWESFVDQVIKADCLAALTKLLARPPPTNFRDGVGVPCNNETGEVVKFYFNGAEQSAKLEGALVGDERDQWYDEMKQRLELFRAAGNSE